MYCLRMANTLRRGDSLAPFYIYCSEGGDIFKRFPLPTINRVLRGKLQAVAMRACYHFLPLILDTVRDIGERKL